MVNFTSGVTGFCRRKSRKFVLQTVASGMGIIVYTFHLLTFSFVMHLME